MGQLILITGTDDFAIKNQAKKTIVEICGESPEDNSALEIIKGDSDELKPQEIINSVIASIKTPPFFDPTKIIWLKHFGDFEKSLAGTVKDRKGKPIEELTDMIKEGLPDDVTLIVDGLGAKKSTSFFKAFDKMGKTFSFEKVELSDKNYKQNQRIKIQQICDQSKKRIVPAAIDYLIETAGSDTGRLQNELDKVFCYIGLNDTITLDDCKAICSHTPEALSWAFADALIDRNTTRALETINILMEQMRAEKGSGNQELRLLNNAVGRFQQMISAKSTVAQFDIPQTTQYNTFSGVLDRIPQDIKDQNKGNILLSGHPYRAFMLYSSAIKISDGRLADAIKYLLAANKALVSGGGNSRIVLEQLAIKLTA